MVLSAPSKSFLIGEYAVLKGGAALIVNTGPRFELRVRAGLTSQNPFHSESPAGKFYELNADKLSQFTFDFFDPHSGKGGLGASSAQFALLYSFLNDGQVSDYFKMLQIYKGLSAQFEGVTPSGYDVLAQTVGGVSLIEAQHLLCESLPWRFSDLGFFILRTGNKVATHSHLRNLSKTDFDQLSKISEYAVQTYVAGDREQFLQSVSLFRKALYEQKLTAEESVEILHELDKNPLIVASKGCGALGADVVIVFFDLKNKTDVKSSIEKHFDIIGDEMSLQQGLQVKNLSLPRDEDMGMLKLQ